MNNVAYLIELRDKFSAAAERIAKAARDAMKGAEGMGAAVIAAEKAVLSASTALGRGTAAMQANGRAVEANRRVHQQWATDQERIAQKQLRMLETVQAKQGLIDAGMLPGKKPGILDRGIGWGGLWHGMMVLGMGHMAFRGARSLVERGASVDQMLQKMRMAGVDEELVDQARSKAFDLSAANPNMKVSEILGLMNDARGALVGSMHEIVHKDIEQFVQAGSFLKAYDGGKHAHKTDSIMHELYTAMRSAEDLGLNSAEQIGRHVKFLTAMKVVYGDKLSIRQLFTAQQAAQSALFGLNDNFTYVKFPAMVQALGQRAGTGLMTLTNKTLLGIMVRAQSGKWWADHDLVNMDKVKVAKSGGVIPTAAGWLKNHDLLGRDPHEWLLTTVLPAMAARNEVRGLNMPAILGAYQAMDPEKMLGAINDINKAGGIADLKAQLGRAGYDRTAVTSMIMMILRSPSIMRDFWNMERALKSMGQMEGYYAATGALAAQADMMWNALLGKEFVPWISDNIKTVAGWFGWLGKELEKNPDLREGMQKGLMGALGVGGLAAFGLLGKALRGGFRATGIPMMLGGVTKIAQWGAKLLPAALAASRFAGALRLIAGFSAVGIVFGGLTLAIQHWEKLAALIQKVSNLLSPTAGRSNAQLAHETYYRLYAEREEMARQGPLGPWFAPARTPTFRESENASWAAYEKMSARGDAERTIKIDIPPEIIIRIPGVGVGSIPIRVQAPRGRAVDDVPLYAN
jgi:hypothetical protein